jgi:hypothetical protein
VTPIAKRWRVEAPGQAGALAAAAHGASPPVPQDTPYLRKTCPSPLPHPPRDAPSPLFQHPQACPARSLRMSAASR